MSPSWLRPGGLEVRIITVDERPIEPEITVEVLATEETKTVPIGKLSSSEGDLSVYREAEEIIRAEDDD